MEVRKFVAPAGVAAIMISIAAGSIAPASAANNIKPFGQRETINDVGTGNPVIGYTVTGLQTSSAAVPHNGQLYEATVTVDAPAGWATPIVPMFNARAESGDNYRVVGGGVDPAPPGGSTTGKIYFDVVGPVPNSVVYSDGIQDLLVWVPGAPEGGVPGSNGSGAPDVAGEQTQIIGNAPADGGGVTGGNLATPADVTPPPPDVNPYETPEQHDRGR